MSSARKKVHPAKMRLVINERDFLSTLNYRPQELNDKLNAAILSLAADYEENFPAQRCELVRRAFAIFARYRENINTGKLLAKKGRTPLLETFDRYCSLCGMLGSVRILLQEDREKSPHTQQLAEELGAILQATLMHMTDDGDRALPKCVQRFELKYGVYSRVELQLAESLLYNSFLEKLNYRLTRLKAHFSNEPNRQVERCYRRGKKLQEMLAQEFKKPEADIAFLTAVLKTTWLLLDKPHDVHLQEKFARLGKYAPGNPSLARKVVSCMQMFLGALIIAASTLVSVMAPTPWVAAGFSLGAFLIGNGLFALRRTGYAKQITDLAKAEKKAQEPLIPIARAFGYAPGYVFGS